jgi:hypothetical protein
MANTSATGGPLLPTGPDLAADLDFDRILTRVVRGITGLPDGSVFPRNQDVPPDQPDKATDWCAVGETERTLQSQPSQIHIGDGDGYTVLRSTAKVEALASFYGLRARNLAHLFSDALWVAQNREYLNANGIGFVTTGTLRNSAALVNTTFRRRYDVPFTLMHVIERRYEIRNVVQADGTIRATANNVSGVTQMDTPFLTPLPPA